MSKPFAKELENDFIINVSKFDNVGEDIIRNTNPGTEFIDFYPIEGMHKSALFDVAIAAWMLAKKGKGRYHRDRDDLTKSFEGLMLHLRAWHPRWCEGLTKGYRLLKST